MADAISKALLPDTAVLSEDDVAIGGVSLRGLAEKYGTPLFVYDEATLRQRARDASRSFDDGVAFASKAFLCGAMARLAVEEGLCVDVSTAGELDVVLRAGVAPERIVVHGNNKSTEEIARALDVGVHRIIVDSFDEIDRLEHLVGVGREATCVLRVTPGVEAHTHEFIKTGQEDTKFGFSLASGDARLAAARLRGMNHVRLIGLHFHIGSQIFELASFEEAIGVVAEFCRESGVSELCVGGGLGVAYVAGESAPSISQWAHAVREALAAQGLGDLRVTAEPGRSIVASAGITLYTVGTIKEAAGRTYLAVDGGMSDNPRPVLYGSGYEAFLVRAPLAARPASSRVVGKHCETGDLIIDAARLPDGVVVGDVIATPVTGAYGYSMASNYNRVPRPAVVFVADGHDRLVLRRETLDDLVRLEV